MFVHVKIFIISMAVVFCSFNKICLEIFTFFLLIIGVSYYVDKHAVGREKTFTKRRKQNDFA